MFLAETLPGIEVIDYQRGIHADFELHVVYCDTLPEFKLEYDRVKAECRLEIAGAKFSDKLEQQIYTPVTGITINSIHCDDASSSIKYDMAGTTYVRAYIVSGPPALMLDFSKADDIPGRFPFELDKDEYRHQGSLAENSGELELALEYIEWIERTGPADPVLVHRAGIIQHKLGRWETALETFSKSLDQPELLADARAHRSMIYLAMGDTISSGWEWSSYFHKKTPEMIHEETASSAPDIPETRQKPEKKKNPLPFSILRAGDGNAIYLGGAIFIIGVFVLVRLLTGNRTTSSTAFHYYNSEERMDSSENLYWNKTDLSSISKREQPELYPSSDRDVRSGPTIPKVSKRVMDSYRTNPAIRQPVDDPKKIERRAGRGVPVDLIIEKARDGSDELEIARSVGISRDEVAMVLNLSRLAGRN